MIIEIAQVALIACTDLTVSRTAGTLRFDFNVYPILRQIEQVIRSSITDDNSIQTSVVHMSSFDREELRQTYHDKWHKGKSKDDTKNQSSPPFFTSR